MYQIRRWISGNPGYFERLYILLESILLKLDPLFRVVGYVRLDKPVALVEKVIKGPLFDTQMCGMCTLSATGMVCPMNCPKQLRNGPCGGVRQDGSCEIHPDMHCVWLDIINGSRRLGKLDELNQLMPPVDHSLKGSSAWLRAVRSRLELNEQA